MKKLIVKTLDFLLERIQEGLLYTQRYEMILIMLFGSVYAQTNFFPIQPIPQWNTTNVFIQQDFFNTNVFVQQGFYPPISIRIENTNFSMPPNTNVFIQQNPFQINGFNQQVPQNIGIWVPINLEN